MHKKTYLLILGIALICFASSYSQELKCNIQVNSQQIQGSNKKIFQTLQTALYEFMNNKAWTSHVFTVNERIECNIMINISEQISADEFRGSIQVQSRRPVYNSSYNTVLLNYKDDNFNFKYVEFEAIEFNERTHKSNLAAVLAFYAYVIIGLDYDSYSLEGGSEYFQKADRIITNAQSSSDKGWKPFDAKSNKSRYWLLKNLLDKRYAPIREFYYKYHRKGLDLMDSKPLEAVNEITDDLKLLQIVYNDKPDPFMLLLQILFDAKADEIVNIYSESMPDVKSRAFTILNEIDNANASKYQKIISSQ
jgi:hypothetical protein